MMRKKIVAGNWKMNLSKDEAIVLLKDLESNFPTQNKCEIIICPSSIYIDLALHNAKSYAIGLQNVSDKENGAYTGEISASMIQSMNVEYCIVGHSERRQYFGDTDEIINSKMKQLLKHNITPILCCGELFEEREQGKQNQVVQNQIEKAIEGLSNEEIEKLVIAYEPVWAIGTGKTASTSQAQEMHAYIRSILKSKIGDVSNNISILYGGSCKPENAKELFASKDIDGGLIGGAALKSDSFLQIVDTF